MDQSWLGLRLREPIAVQISLWVCPKKRVRRCAAASPAGESSVERVLDGGGVPLMRERAKGLL